MFSMYSQTDSGTKCEHLLEKEINCLHHGYSLFRQEDEYGVIEVRVFRLLTF